jgi:hypothetical protein
MDVAVVIALVEEVQAVVERSRAEVQVVFLSAVQAALGEKDQVEVAVLSSLRESLGSPAAQLL